MSASDKPPAADLATITTWLPEESHGVATTDTDRHEVWIFFPMLRGGLRTDQLYVGKRVHLTYEPTPDQDGYKWIGIEVTPLPR
ncbi:MULTISPECIES: hypothetical protein [Cellulosimicrobium]|jgi:hypothetical protein|uniref:Cold shock domain-containing protein n=1 Tax=Cellulosimicrobium cellulans TaxID=1710 RepID=A0AAV5PES3_CELCE|nr:MULTISPECIES: hypothetical protein [Cellulosimicrobium]ARK05020.1 hypothetical protein B8281_10020 [Cellulosimicrobium sp. TH-20]KFD43314.1 hypothetical protein IU11_12385 [Cellulosimicrobium sp. MM]MBE9938729.1 hypothetical protein [Cellulosimicrobium cellulans]QDP76227.1 hypothetical protein FOG94_14900 [Cellulosimicrobium cellulans]UTT58165.1 hypothetical protein NMQ07_12925 [Cellulosimicrobium cellulans]